MIRQPPSAGLLGRAGRLPGRGLGAAIAAVLAAAPGLSSGATASAAADDPPRHPEPGASAASGDREPVTEPALPRTVVCTTGMVADLVRTVLGPGSQVQALMGPGVDPHLYKPTRDDVARIMAAELVVANGLMLEGRMGELLARAGRDRWTIVLGDLLPAERLIQPDGAEGHPDPHVWMDPALWAIAAEQFASTVASRLGRAPCGASAADGASGLSVRAARYAATLRELDAWARECIGTIPQSQRVLITSHDAFAYLGRAYGLRVEGVQGVSTDSEPGLRRIRELVDLVVTHRVPAVFIESSVPPRSVEALVEGARARGLSISIGGELYSDALGPVGSWEGTVPGMLDHNITTIVRALGGSAPQRGWRGRLAPLPEAPPSDASPESGADAPAPPCEPGPSAKDSPSSPTSPEARRRPMAPAEAP